MTTAPVAGYVYRMADDDFELLKPTTLVRVAGIALLLSGLFALVLGAQTLYLYSVVTVVKLRHEVAPIEYMGWVFLLLGVASMGAGQRTMRASGVGAVAGTVVAMVSTLAAFGYYREAAAWHLFSPLALLLLGLSGVALVLAGLAIPRCIQADAARARLREAGLDAGT